jgi:nitroreductase/NAD-dependent dihydropyrimidine dehydrogenase PreA subunit
MTLLKIDPDKCKQDGLCAADCPMAIIRFEGRDGYPHVAPDDEAMCVACGHCVAVCPHGALDHARVPRADCAPIEKDLVLSTAQAGQFLRTRRSVRHFKDQPVDRATLQRVIETGRYAPTAGNAQLVEWRVIDDQQRLRQIAEGVIGWLRELLKADPQCKALPNYFPRMVSGWEGGDDTVMRSAPCLVVAMAPAQDRNGLVDVTLALSYLELAAMGYGLGTCWAGLLQGAMMSIPALKEAVGVPSDYPHHYPMMIGYSKVRYYRLPERKPPKIHWN